MRMQRFIFFPSFAIMKKDFEKTEAGRRLVELVV